MFIYSLDVNGVNKREKFLPPTNNHFLSHSSVYFYLNASLWTITSRYMREKRTNTHTHKHTLPVFTFYKCFSISVVSNRIVENRPNDSINFVPRCSPSLFPKYIIFFFGPKEVLNFLLKLMCFGFR